MANIHINLEPGPPTYTFDSEEMIRRIGMPVEVFAGPAAKGFGHVVVQIPSQSMPGHPLLLFVETTGIKTTNEIATPAGWTFMEENHHRIYISDGPGMRRMSVFFRMATDIETDPVINSPDDQIIAQILACRAKVSIRPIISTNVSPPVYPVHLD